MAVAPAVRHDLPRAGYTVFFRESEHAYRKANPKGKPGGKLPGCTTISDALPSKPEGLMRYAVRKDQEAICEMVRQGIKIPTDPLELAARVREWGKTHEDHRDQRGVEGKAVHKVMFEGLALGGDVPALNKLQPGARGFGQAVQAAWLQLDPEPLTVDQSMGMGIEPRPCVEQPVMSLEHGFAGTLDLRALVKLKNIPPPTSELWATPPEIPPGADEAWLLDLKTSKGIYPKFHAQAEGYEIGARECKVGRTDRRVILQVREDGSWRLHDSVCTAADFLHALEMYRRGQRIEKLIEKRRG